jgi:predicted HTH domain antitoxin
MIQITVDIPEGSLASLHKDPESFAREMRIAAAVQWYARRELSQERAAELAGLSRPAFVEALGRYGVSPFQATAAELVREAMDG